LSRGGQSFLASPGSQAPEPVQPVEPVEPVEATAAKKSSMRKSVAPKVNLKDLNLPKDATKEFDVDGDGEVDVAELIAHVQKHKNLQKSHNFLTKVLLLTLVVMILFLVLCLGASVLAIQLTKEMTVSGGALTATGTCGDGQDRTFIDDGFKIHVFGQNDLHGRFKWSNEFQPLPGTRRHVWGFCEEQHIFPQTVYCWGS